MNLTSIFTGVPQSRYAGLAVLLAIVVVSISILFGKESMPLSQKIGAILLLIIVSAPGILFSLFQITCLVTGAGVRNQRPWCAIYAWLITALLVVYSVLLVAIAILSIATGSKSLRDLTNYNVEKFENNMSSANLYASNIFGAPATKSNNPNTMTMENFTNTPARSPAPARKEHFVGDAAVAGSTYTGNVFSPSASSKLDNKSYSYSSSVLSTEQFRGAVGDPNNVNSRIVGGMDEAAPFPYDNGTLVPKEKFVGIVGDPNNRNSRVVGGMSDPSSYPFN